MLLDLERRNIQSSVSEHHIVLNITICVDAIQRIYNMEVAETGRVKREREYHLNYSFDVLQTSPSKESLLPHSQWWQQA